ncbi:MAG: SUMF1/EgtB/PvdO family nonheme iron enzyme [Pseudomonadota bacterium]
MFTSITRALLLPLVSILSLGYAAPALAARHALLIGNDSYQSVPKLRNARGDAEAMGRALRKAGYEITLVKDRSLKQLKDDIRLFKTQLHEGDEVVLFYAGHGVQIGAMNYLLPIDVRSDTEDQVTDDGLALSKVLEDIREQRPALTLAIIDACRDNPFKGKGRAIGGRGLTGVGGATGQMVIYSAGEGQQALDRLGDNDPDKNGVFTRVFIKEMETVGVSVDQVARRVREQVNSMARKVKHDQVPAIYDQVLGQFYFYAPSATAGASASGVVAAADTNPAVLELAFWNSVKDSRDISELQEYLNKYPKGQFAGLVQTRKLSIEQSQRLSNQAASAKQNAAPASADAQETAFWKNVENVNSAAGYQSYLAKYPAGAFVATARGRLATPKVEADAKLEKSFRDCPDCAEMINIPKNNLVQAFALSKTEVTQAQWRNIMGTSPSQFKSCDDCPVEQVSWNDTKEFLSRLNRKTGKQYRLPTESEWEYACRAGGNNDYCGTNNVDDAAWFQSNSASKTHAVATKQINAYGIADMNGNVWEWVDDCWHANDNGVPKDGSLWAGGDCTKHAVRGGSWVNAARDLRASFRIYNDSSQRLSIIGFRLARSLP